MTERKPRVSLSDPDLEHVSASRFARDTAVEAVDSTHYVARIVPGWAVMDGGAPNGGYLLAIGARAMSMAVGKPDPVSITAHYLAPADEGPIDINVEVVRLGRRHATVTAAMIQQGRERVQLLATFADLGDNDGEDIRVDLSPPAYPPVQECLDFTKAGTERAAEGGYPPPPILQRFDHRVPEELAGWTVGQPAGRGEIGGYVRFSDGAEMDPFGVLTVLDAYPPAVYNSGDSTLGWVPTIELTVHLRRRPSAGYLTTRMRTQAITAGGYLEEDGEVWDAQGRLVALSRQLALAAR